MACAMSRFELAPASRALTPMMQCLLETGELSAKELAGLETLIKEKKKKAGKK